MLWGLEETALPQCSHTPREGPWAKSQRHRRAQRQRRSPRHGSEGLEVALRAKRLGESETAFRHTRGRRPKSLFKCTLLLKRAELCSCSFVWPQTDLRLRLRSSLRFRRAARLRAACYGLVQCKGTATSQPLEL